MKSRKYTLSWYLDNNPYSKRVASGLSCKLEGHGSIESFGLSIVEEDGHKEYRFRIHTISVMNDSGYSILDKTLDIQKSVNLHFQCRKLKLNSWSSYSDLTLLDETKESAIACASVLFSIIDLNPEDQSKITEFLKTGNLQLQQTLEILLKHVSENKISEALNKAFLLEKRGYNGILLKFFVELLGDGNNVQLNTAILNAVLEKNVSLDVIDYLLTLKIDWTYLNESGQPLIHTAFNHSLHALPSMLQAGADINQIDKYGNTLMHIIASQEASNLLLAKLNVIFDCGANPILRAPNSNMTAYQRAYMNENHIVAQYIAEYTKRFNGHIEPHNTIEAQLEQIRACQEREKPKPQLDEKRILARLQELEMAQQKLQEEKAQLLEKLNQRPISVADYDRQDYALIKAMLVFYIDKIAEFPAQASELLRKASVPAIKTETEIAQIIKNVFEGSSISNADRDELSIDLKEINSLASKDRKQLKLRSQVEYKADDIANMVREAAKDLILEKQITASKTTTNSQQPPQSVVATLKNTSSPLHRSTSNSANYTTAPGLEKKLTK